MVSFAGDFFADMATSLCGESLPAVGKQRHGDVQLAGLDTNGVICEQASRLAGAT